MSYEVLAGSVINKEGNFKLNYFLKIEDTVIECIDRRFDLCANHEADLCLILAPQGIENAKGNMKMMLYKFRFKLNLDL